MQMAMLLLLAACVVREDHVLRRVLIWWPLRRIGIVSYGIYLYHMFVYWPVARLLGVLGWESDLLLFGGVAAGAWCVAEISYRSFELKFLQRKERFAAFFERRLDRRKTVATF
jgi:peptidoglycan/LPS O-acetylase OafA/YrhL